MITWGDERCCDFTFPADYCFLYFLGFWFDCFLKTDPLRHFFSALAFGLLSRVSILFGHD
jgi:hypothetical protein